VLELFRFFLSFSAAGTLIMLLGGLALLAWVDDVGRRHEWWGVPTRLVQVDRVAFVDPESWAKDGLPRITGIIRNNYDKPLSRYIIKVDFYRCPASKTDMATTNDCNQVWAPGQSSTEDYEVRLGIAPGESAEFSEIHSLSDYSRIRREYETPGWFVAYDASVSYAAR
jgi:hypothetical protein